MLVSNCLGKTNPDFSGLELHALERIMEILINANKCLKGCCWMIIFLFI